MGFGFGVVCLVLCFTSALSLNSLFLCRCIVAALPCTSCRVSMSPIVRYRLNVPFLFSWILTFPSGSIVSLDSISRVQSTYVVSNCTTSRVRHSGVAPALVWIHHRSEAHGAIRSIRTLSTCRTVQAPSILCKKPLDSKCGVDLSRHENNPTPVPEFCTWVYPASYLSSI